MPSFPYQDTIRLSFTRSAGTVTKGQPLNIGGNGPVAIAAETKVFAAGSLTQDMDVWAPGCLYVRGAARNTGDGAWTAGSRVYSNGTNFSTTATNRVLAGIAAKAAASGDATADIILVPTVA